ncbi:mCG147720 [Mus musculus]|nr:mCG147720 [Mus musculus]
MLTLQGRFSTPGLFSARELNFLRARRALYQLSPSPRFFES